MNDFFGHEFFSSNRDRLQTEVDSKLIVLAANGLMQRSADTTFPFRQDSNFWYLTGISEPDYTLVISETDTFLIAPRRADHRDLWDGEIDQTSLKITSGIETVEEYHNGWNRLDRLIKKYGKVHTVAPFEPYFEHFGFYANPARGALLSALQKHRKLEVVDIRKTLARLRQIKQASELAAIQSAIDLTVQAVQQIKSKLKTYQNEGEVNADITAVFLRGGSQHAYQPIIAAGKNAATIHYIANDAAINGDDLLLMDVGAEISNYSADLTRTYSIQKPSKRQQQVHEAVLSVRNNALELLKPGVDMKVYEQEVDQIMAKELKRLKLIDDVNDKKKLKKYYPHLTSHFLGLDTHDAADYQLPLAPGMVLTVEPGIYIAEEGIGIRLEDDVLVTETGVEVLSSALSLDLN